MDPDLSDVSSMNGERVWQRLMAFDGLGNCVPRRAFLLCGNNAARLASEEVGVEDRGR